MGVSIAVFKYHKQKQLREEGAYFTFRIIDRHQGKSGKELQVETG